VFSFLLSRSLSRNLSEIALGMVKGGGKQEERGREGKKEGMGAWRKKAEGERPEERRESPRRPISSSAWHRSRF
jgi:hypothetical protein